LRMYKCLSIVLGTEAKPEVPEPNEGNVARVANR